MVPIYGTPGTTSQDAARPSPLLETDLAGAGPVDFWLRGRGTRDVRSDHTAGTAAHAATDVHAAAVGNVGSRPHANPALSDSGRYGDKRATIAQPVADRSANRHASAANDNSSTSDAAITTGDGHSAAHGSTSRPAPRS